MNVEMFLVKFKKQFGLNKKGEKLYVSEKTKKDLVDKGIVEEVKGNGN